MTRTFDDGVTYKTIGRKLSDLDGKRVYNEYGNPSVHWAFRFHGKKYDADDVYFLPAFNRPYYHDYDDAAGYDERHMLLGTIEDGTYYISRELDLKAYGYHYDIRVWEPVVES